MTKKESSENIFTEFFKILEGQKKAQEMTKPVMEYQQRLFMESLELQKALMENIMETTKRMLRIMSENPMKYGSGSTMQGLGMGDDKFSEYMRNMQKVQESWMEQLKSTASMFQDQHKKRGSLKIKKKCYFY